MSGTKKLYKTGHNKRVIVFFIDLSQPRKIALSYSTREYVIEEMSCYLDCDFSKYSIIEVFGNVKI